MADWITLHLEEAGSGLVVTKDTSSKVVKVNNLIVVWIALSGRFAWASSSTEHVQESLRAEAESFAQS